jgi:hypothetical protein
MNIFSGFCITAGFSIIGMVLVFSSGIFEDNYEKISCILIIIGGICIAGGMLFLAINLIYLGFTFKG